jgi:hypothetical protein
MLVVLTKGTNSPHSTAVTRLFLPDGDYYLAISSTPVETLTSNVFYSQPELSTSSSVTYTPTQQVHLPDTAHVGDAGSYVTLSKTDGTTDTVTWKLDPEYNGNSKLVISTTTQNASNITIALEEEIFYLDAHGTVYRIEIVSTINGVTVTLSGSKS